MNKTAVTIGLTIAAIGAFSLSILKRKSQPVVALPDPMEMVRDLMTRYDPMTVAHATHNVASRIEAGEYIPKDWQDLLDANELECMLLEADL